MRVDLRIQGGSVIADTGLVTADLAILDGKIVGAWQPGMEAAETIAATGLVVMPGMIDTQVHFREPGLEHKEDLESGTRSALMGGVTTIFEMPNTNPTTTTPEALQDKLDRARGRAWCHYAFFVGASVDNIETLAHLETLPGTPGVKIFMGSSTGSLLVSGDDDLRRVLRNGKKRCPIHAEDEPRNTARKALISDQPHPREHPFLRDAESARLATERILRLSAETGRPVHVLHVSTHEELPLLAEAKRQGLGTTCEVTPQHLWFAAPECYDQLGSLAQMNPPIRSQDHREGLWKAVDAGLFDVFGSDHAPHTLEEKSNPYPKSPSGMPGVQTILPALLTFAAHGRLSLATVQRMACARPAELYGVRGKGRIAPGYDADLVLVDPAAKWTFQRAMVESKCGWSPYEGVEFTGSIEHVILGGQIAVRDRTRVGSPSGRMVEFE